MKPSKNENEHIWVEEMQARMAKLAKEQQAKSEAEKSPAEGSALDALPKMRAEAGAGEMRRGGD